MPPLSSSLVQTQIRSTLLQQRPRWGPNTLCKHPRTLPHHHRCPPPPMPTTTDAHHHRCPPPPLPTTTHGGIGCTLSLSTLSPPFKVVLMLPNPCVMSRDSHNAKTDMQMESLKFFVAYSTTHTTMSARRQERDEQLAQGKPFNLSIRSFVRLSPTVYADAQNLKI